jgi:hypothetical protein
MNKTTGKIIVRKLEQNETASGTVFINYHI